MDLTGYHSGQGERKVRRQKGTGMEQKRYESDMTPKEKRELERKKLKQMTAGQKLEYIWAYYKPHMAVALGQINIMNILLIIPCI